MRTTDPSIINFQEKFDLTGKAIVISGTCGLIGRTASNNMLVEGGWTGW